MEMIKSVKLDPEHYFKRVAGEIIAPPEINQSFLEMFGEDGNDVDLRFSDITSVYLDEWKNKSLEGKKAFADEFKKIHQWVFETAGFYNLKMWHIFPGMGYEEGTCRTCSGAGLYVHMSQPKIVETDCPACHGTGLRIATCKRCNGKGCETCKGSGIYVFYKNRNHPEQPCRTCSIETPFGQMRSNGKVIRQIREVTGVSICTQCQGYGHKFTNSVRISGE